MQIKVKVYPKSKQSKIIQEEILKIYVKQPAENGKANQVVIQMLSDFYGIKKSDIKIIKGEKSREKLIELNV